MKKVMGSLIIAVESRTTNTRRSSKNIGSYINRVPCHKQALEKPTEMESFINKQMSEYPLPPKIHQSKREKLLGEKIKYGLNRNKKIFKELVSKLEQKLTFLDLEDMRAILKNMNQKQISENRTGLRALKYSVKYILESSQEKVQVQDHVYESAMALLDEIQEISKKKIRLVV